MHHVSVAFPRFGSAEWAYRVVRRTRRSTHTTIQPIMTMRPPKRPLRASTGPTPMLASRRALASSSNACCRGRPSATG